MTRSSLKIAARYISDAPYLMTMANLSADKLAEEATGNVKKKHLTKDSGMLFTYLYNGPLIEHLNDGEQPEYVFSHNDKGYRITEENGDERTPHHNSSEGKLYLLVTDQRVLYVAGCKYGDETIEHSYDQIVDIEASGRGVSRNIQFRSVNGRMYKFVPQGSHKIIVNAAIDYASERATGTEQEPTRKKEANEPESESTDVEEKIRKYPNLKKDQTTSKSELQEKVDELSNIDMADLRDIKNDSIPSNLIELGDNIRPDETFHYAYEINAAKRGDDQMGGYTTGGCLLATDKRLTAYINETIGSSNLSIGYDKIDTVEIEHGAVTTKLSVQSTSKTYTFPGFNNIDKSEIHDFADFIRNKASEPGTDETSESNIDPTEQLKNIKELHDQDVLTDKEFEEKKQSLLDKL